MTWVARTKAKGNRIIALIEAYKTQHGEAPKDLTTVGIPLNNNEGREYEGEIFYYNNMNDGTYMLYFTRNSDDNHAYYSLLKTWMHGFYTNLAYEKKGVLRQNIHDTTIPR